MFVLQLLQVCVGAVIVVDLGACLFVWYVLNSGSSVFNRVVVKVPGDASSLTPCIVAK